MKKLLLLAICGLIIGSICPSPIVVSESRGGKLLGSKECTWGPSFWCESLSNAKNCKAVPHCIQTVWEHQTLPVDNDSVCQICLKMVTEARDQLNSNETQEDLKEVFEGSCRLIHIKPIVKECDKLVDDFIPELIEALTSQMNPNVVCSVAGLCNSAKIDKLLLENQESPIKKIEKPELTCDKCYTLVDKMNEKFQSKRETEVLNTMLYVCGKIGTLSDACSNIMLTYFKDIYSHLENSFTSENVCHMAGVCAARYHSHPESKSTGIQITPLSAVGVVDVESDNLPCDLCEQLVKHLKDILVANTTELEFKHVMEGLCNQTKTFKSECLSIVDQHYDEVYRFLISELDANDVCFLAGICEKKDTSPLAGTWRLVAEIPTPIWPLVSAEIAVLTLKTYSEDEHKPRKISTGPKLSASEINSMQLPVNRYIPHVIIDQTNPELCTFCEYFLHFVQETISTPKNEDAIKKAVDGICDRLPTTVSGQCKSFVSVYGDAFIALFIQEIDPAQICPKLALCPSKDENHNVEIFMRPVLEEKSTCPMCLLAISEIESQIKSNKSKEAIERALDNLCTHLPKSLSAECNDLVHSYYNEIVEMVIAEFNPQEVCCYIKFCDDPTPDTSLLQDVTPIDQTIPNENYADIMTNEIQDYTVNGVPTSVVALNKEKVTAKPTCAICEFIIKQLQSELKDKTTDEEIKAAVRSVCGYMPKTLSTECSTFIDKYGDLLIQLLSSAVQPEEVCNMMALCAEKRLEAEKDIVECGVCEGAVLALEKLLKNKNVDDEVEHLLGKVCHLLPPKRYKKCKEMVDIYGISFINLISTMTNPHTVCSKVGLCATVEFSGTLDMEDV